MRPYSNQPNNKPIFNEFITPIGLIVHLYHDKPQLKTKDQNGNIPDIGPDGLQLAEYKVTIAWDKSAGGILQPIIDLAHQTKEQAWPGSSAPGAFFNLESFFRDGDNPAHNTKNREYLRNKYYLNFKQKAVAERDNMGQIKYSGGPGLLGPYGPDDKIMPTDIYPGCTGRASGVMFGSEYMGKHFISTRLNNIQKYEDGDRIGGGGRPTAESQFGAIKQGQQGFGGNPFGNVSQPGGNAFAPAQTQFGAQPSSPTNMFGNAGGRTIL